MHDYAFFRIRIHCLQETQITVSSSTEELVRQAGYVPFVFNLPTQNNYSINLIRVFNPLINNNRQANGTDGSKLIRKRKRSVLFIHGVFGNANQWILMGVNGGKPQDLSKQDAKNLTDLELINLIGNDLTTRSMPFLLCNLGHDVWLMNRRSTRQSRFISEKMATNEQVDHDSPRPTIESSSNIVHNFVHYLKNQSRLVNNKYYNFSHDEQSEYDLPIVIKHILKTSKSTKLNLITHGTGCLVALQTLAKNPEFNKYGEFIRGLVNCIDIDDNIFC